MMDAVFNGLIHTKKANF